MDWSTGHSVFAVCLPDVWQHLWSVRSSWGLNIVARCPCNILIFISPHEPYREHIFTRLWFNLDSYREPIQSRTIELASLLASSFSSKIDQLARSYRYSLNPEIEEQHDAILKSNHLFRLLDPLFRPNWILIGLYYQKQSYKSLAK
jgi:hypothetical protein